METDITKIKIKISHHYSKSRSCSPRAILRLWM